MMVEIDLQGEGVGKVNAAAEQVAIHKKPPTNYPFREIVALMIVQAIIQTVVIGFSDRKEGQAEGNSPALAVSLMLLSPVLLSLQLNWQAESSDTKVLEKLAYLSLLLSVEGAFNVIGYAVLSSQADNFPKVMSSEYTNAHNPFSDETKKLFEQLSYAFYVWPSILGVCYLLSVAVSRVLNKEAVNLPRDWKTWCSQMFQSSAWKTWMSEMLSIWGASVPMTLATVGSRFMIQNAVTSAAKSYRPVHFAAEAGQPDYDLTPGNQVANFYMQVMNTGFGANACYESPDKNADMTGHGTMTCLVLGACLVLYTLSPEFKKPGYDAAYLSASAFVGIWTLLMRQFANCHSTGAVITAPLVAMFIPLVVWKASEILFPTRQEYVNFWQNIATSVQAVFEICPSSFFKQRNASTDSHIPLIPKDFDALEAGESKVDENSDAVAGSPKDAYTPPSRVR